MYHIPVSRKRVVVAMSGGVDSSVAAFLLVHQGYEVIGMTAKLLPDSCSNESGKCCSAESAHEARRVCDNLDIPHYTSNMVDEFRDAVVRRFTEGYRNGITPNPCVDCNRFIKFDLFFRFMQSVDADMLATGHYARIRDGLLLKGVDSSKDQSYFLAVIRKDRLDRILFPLGDLEKTHVREIAREERLGGAKRPESQDVCFVEKRPDFEELYRNFGFGDYERRKGSIIDEEGRVRGAHSGIESFTLGQRRGMKVGMLEPKYVFEIDAVKNDVFVAPLNHKPITKVKLTNCNWIAQDYLKNERNFEWKLRYRSKVVNGELQIVSKDEDTESTATDSATIIFSVDRKSVV